MHTGVRETFCIARALRTAAPLAETRCALGILCAADAGSCAADPGRTLIVRGAVGAAVLETETGTAGQACRATAGPIVTET